MTCWGRLMAFLMPRRAAEAAQRRLDHAVSEVVLANEDATQAARGWGASTEIVRLQAQEVEEAASRRLQAQETRRQARSGSEARMLELFGRLQTEASRTKRDPH